VTILPCYRDRSASAYVRFTPKADKQQIFRQSAVCHNPTRDGPKSLCNFLQRRRLKPALHDSGTSYLLLSQKFGANTGQPLKDPSGNVRLHLELTTH
jgi:hypothetical protein